ADFLRVVARGLPGPDVNDERLIRTEHGCDPGTTEQECETDNEAVHGLFSMEVNRQRPNGLKKKSSSSYPVHGSHNTRYRGASLLALNVWPEANSPSRHSASKYSANTENRLAASIASSRSTLTIRSGLPSRCIPQV